MIKVIVLLIFLFVFSSCDNKPKYTRSQCITKTLLFWDDSLTRKERLKINNDFVNARFLMWLNKDRLKLLIPDNAFSSSNEHKPKFMYSQYQDKCNHKEKMLMVFLEHIKFYVPNFPKYKITQEVIQPSINTIESNGEWWIDGCTWKGNTCVNKK